MGWVVDGGSDNGEWVVGLGVWVGSWGGGGGEMGGWYRVGGMVGNKDVSRKTCSLPPRMCLLLLLPPLHCKKL